MGHYWRERRFVDLTPIDTFLQDLVTAAPPHHFATESGVVMMARQVESALGVAVLVTVLGPVTSALACHRFLEGMFASVARASPGPDRDGSTTCRALALATLPERTRSGAL